MFRFDPKIFRGNSRPVKTCCFCKKDGHIKENCPELRKPPLLKLPPMTPEFDVMVDLACRTCRGRSTRQLICCKKRSVIISRWRSRFSRQPLYFIGMDLIPKWRRMTDSFVCMLISPLCLVNMYKKQKNFEVKMRLRGLINMQTKEQFIGRHFGIRSIETEGPFCRLTRLKKWVRDHSRKDYRSHIFALVKQVYHAV